MYQEPTTSYTPWLHRIQRPWPDPWLFDSEALLRELDRCRETVLQIPITNANATHFGIQIAVNAIWNLSENLLHLHREQQRSIRRQHEKSLSSASLDSGSTLQLPFPPFAQ